MTMSNHKHTLTWSALGGEGGLYNALRCVSFRDILHAAKADTSSTRYDCHNQHWHYGVLYKCSYVEQMDGVFWQADRLHVPVDQQCQHARHNPHIPWIPFQY